VNEQFVGADLKIRLALAGNVEGRPFPVRLALMQKK